MPPSLAILGGTGAEGFGLACRFSHAGLPVLIGSRDLAKAQAAASQLPNATGLLNPNAASQANIVILTVPSAARLGTIESIRDHLRPGTILVDTTVHMQGPPPPPPQVPVPLVAAFHTVSAHLLQQSSQPLDSDILLCGDDPTAKAAVSDLIRLLPGARPVDAGPMKNAPLLESLAVLLIRLNRVHGVKHSGVRITGLP
jgi:predicted dinucleotide-binding enzyme